LKTQLLEICNQAIGVMEILSVKKYNERQTKKFEERSKEVWDKIKAGKALTTELPQLAFYIFNKSHGFVAFTEKRAIWAKTKKELLELQR
jgi:hypothetical protein